MKTKLIFLKTFVFLLIATQCGFAQKSPSGGGLTYGDRGIIWIHGYQGSVGSWNVYQGYVNKKYKAQSLPLSYNSNLGFNSGAQQILNLELDPPQGEAPPHMIVAHSFGGLVTRALVGKDPKITNAYITAGTPHAGSVGMDLATMQKLTDNLINKIDPIK
jgi:triacylglycerol esterase/lipase EstA (alpha/beta hydrolase family)